MSLAASTTSTLRSVNSNSKNNNNNGNNKNRLNLGGLGIGLMQWGTTNIDNNVVNPKGNLSNDTVQNIWKQCRDKDIVFFDTAEGYGGGTSETRICQVRKWYEETQVGDDKDRLDKEKSKVIVATKFLPTLWRWTKSSFYKSLHGSLNRLGVDCIDLYFIHTPIHPLPIEYFIQWSCDAIDDGLIKHIGISNCNADLVKRAHAVATKNNKHIECNQIMLNLLVWNSSKHQETVQVCHALGIQIVAYSPIGQGLLTDNLTREKFDTIRAVKMTGVQYDGELEILRNEIYGLSKIHNKTMAQVAMNWVRGHNAIPLVGIRSTKQVQDAQDGLNWSLSSDEISKLDKLSLGLSLFERPLLRRCMFVIFISLLQLAYYTEIRYTKLKKSWFAATTTISNKTD